MLCWILLQDMAPQSQEGGMGWRGWKTGTKMRYVEHQHYLSPLFQTIFFWPTKVQSIHKGLNNCLLNDWKKKRKNRPGSTGHSNLLVSQRALCYNIWLNPSRGSQTLRHTPDRPTLGADWYAPHEANSNPQCLLFLLLPSHCLLSEQAVQGGG